MQHGLKGYDIGYNDNLEPIIVDISCFCDVEPIDADEFNEHSAGEFRKTYNEGSEDGFSQGYTI
jgi:hypothetical protein